MRYCYNCCKHLPAGDLTCSGCHAVILDEYPKFTAAMDSPDDNQKLLLNRLNIKSATVEYSEQKSMPHRNSISALVRLSFVIKEITINHEVSYCGILYKLYERKKTKWNVVWHDVCDLNITKKELVHAEKIGRKQKIEGGDELPAVTGTGRKPIPGGLPGQGKSR